MKAGSIVGLGVDIGGSGVRAAAFTRDAAQRLVAARVCELPHAQRGPVEGIAACLAELVEHEEHDEPEHSAPLVVGIAAPGAKTRDGRGVQTARHLAAAPRLLDELEVRLGESGARRLHLPRRLESDAQAALVGERVVRGGLLDTLSGAGRQVLFLGPGSGLAEAQLVGGEVRRVAGVRAAEQPPTRDDGEFSDLEDEASLLGLERRWRALAGERDGELEAVELAAEGGDARARALLERFGEALARVVELRAGLLAELREEARGAAPLLFVRTRRGRFFPSAAARSMVVPRLRAAAERHGATLLVPEQPASPRAACAGALALALREHEPPVKP